MEPWTKDLGISVTRFVEILLIFGHLLRAKIVFWTSFGKLFMLLGKWPNIEHKIKPSGHSGHSVQTTFLFLSKLRFYPRAETLTHLHFLNIIWLFSSTSERAASHSFILCSKFSGKVSSCCRLQIATNICLFKTPKIFVRTSEANIIKY